MDFREMILLQHARAHASGTANPDLSVQDNVLRDATEEQIRLRPQPGFNSLAWIFWHITRTEDIGINLLILEGSQVLDDGDWPSRLNIERRDFGAGMTSDEVDALNRDIDVTALLEYRDAVGRQTQRIIRELNPALLAGEITKSLVQRAQDEGAIGPNAHWIPDRWGGKQKSFALTHTVIAHNFLHLGQGDDIRGMLGLATV